MPSQIFLSHCAAAALALAAARSAQAAVTFGQIDTYQDGTTMEWAEGFATPNPPTNVPDGGPGGTGDAYLQNIATGGFGAGSRQIMFNRSQWTGDFVTAHVTQIDAMLANFGATPLTVRVAFQGGSNFTQFASGNSDAKIIPADGVWRPVTFQLNSSAMVTVNVGGDTLADTLSSVIEMRILSAVAPSWVGDSIASTLGMDNLRAFTLPGDANLDFTVDTIDFNILATNFSGTNKVWSEADFTGEGEVDTVDFNLLAANFSQVVLPSALVPEPACIAAPALLLAARARRRGATR